LGHDRNLGILTPWVAQKKRQVNRRGLDSCDSRESGKKKGGG